MNLKSNITITRTTKPGVVLPVAMLILLLVVQALAHNGFDHVMGTVVNLADNVLTVKTAKGNVDVKLDETTELTKNDHRAQRADLEPGVRVVVDVPEGSKDRIAHSVKIGTAAATDHEHK